MVELIRCGNIDDTIISDCVLKLVVLDTAV